MLYFVYERDALVRVTADHTRDAVDRNDIQTIDHAEAIAEDATRLTGRRHLACDRPSTYPRFDVIEAPVVGAPVSRGFNGDYYPAGVIVKVSPTYKRVETDDGTVFYRVRRSDGWRADGTWWMVAGHRDERNPSF